MCLSDDAQLPLGVGVWSDVVGNHPLAAGRHAMRTTKTGARAADAKLLAMADRLFTDFEELPVGTVFQAIGAARKELREASGRAPTADAIEMLARRRLDAVTRS